MKNISLLLLTLWLSGPLFGQVKFNLHYEPNTAVYTVSIIPEFSCSAPKNIVGSAQIVLRVAANVEFVPGITSLVEGAVWADNAYIEQPGVAPGYRFVCIALASGPNKNIPVAEGQAVPLFSFINVGGGCAGLVELLPNDDVTVQAVRSVGYNVTQHLSMLATRGEAYSGVENGSADCAVSTGSQEVWTKIVGSVQISPVPASESVNIRWMNLADYAEHLDLVITNNTGQVIYREKINGLKGEHTQRIGVKYWKSGAYRVQFQFSGGRRTRGWNLLVTH